ncbi:MAG: hypothetical protein L6Q98_16970 [Anaerolineae bacterium]|nr:hypothetical protein [Anaerolineae bacterium]NUQ03870.1 hypothetical protein [Anaerolineae bacterium]
MARRVWELNASAPLALTLAADARSMDIDYGDDQVWEVSLGAKGSPAFALSTRLGRRVGQISVVPMWWADGKAIYASESYSSSPRLTAFAPGYLQGEAHLTRDLLLQAAYYALDSHAVGIRFTVRSTASAPVRVALDLVGFAASNGQERTPAFLTSHTRRFAALSFGRFISVDPVLALEGGAPGDSARKLSALLVIPANETVTIRAVAVAEGAASESLESAVRWFEASWGKPALSGARARAAAPDIQTGDVDLDALLAFSYQQAMQALVRAPGKLPHTSFVASRQPEDGFRPTADPSGSGLNRVRGGQHPALAYLTALAVAPIAPQAAEGILLNYLAVQKADGWIDWSPGIAGETRGILCLPILARLAWSLWQYTENGAFLAQVYPALRRFLDRWLDPDLDADGDGVPEWQSEAQSAYPFLPIFSRGLPQGQNADIRLIESPDLLAYLLSEAVSLREMAQALNHQQDLAELDVLVARLKRALSDLWSEDLGRYAHRDRDSHAVTRRVELVHDSSANESTAGPLTLEAPARLILEVAGGTSRPNVMTAIIEGIRADGERIVEQTDADAFSWTAGRGSYTSQHAFRQIDHIALQGVVPMYRYSVRTVDTTGLDITALLPLWAVDIEPRHAAALRDLLKSPDHFWRKHGVIMFSARDPQYEPDRNEFAAGVWGFWLTLMGEALVEAGDYAAAADLLRRYFAGMIPVVKARKAFYEGYHAEKAEGLGARGQVGGIAPLHLFLRVIGVRIISERRVWTGGPFPWHEPVMISHQGVTVRRAADGTTITFPTGETVTLPPDAPWQQVDAQPASSGE